MHKISRSNERQKRQYCKSLMGSQRIWDIILMMFCYSCLLEDVQGSKVYSRDSLDSFVYDYAFKKISRSHTGKLNDISLPSNYSGMVVSILRIRTRSLWMKGANLSFFDIPPMILPWPFSRRVDLVYQNLGNWSTLYYNMSNYTFVASVIGLLAYDSSTISPHYGLIELNLMGNNPIVVRFPNVSLSVGMKCVRFSTNGTVELSNVTGINSCMAHGQGHFSIVVPSRLSDKTKKERVWKWWVIGFTGGIVGLILLLVVVIKVYKLIKGEKIKKMERRSERSEVLDTNWIGRSKMPSASGIRTQPEFESSYVP